MGLYDWMWLWRHDLIVTCQSPFDAVYDIALTEFNLIFLMQIIWAWRNYFQKSYFIKLPPGSRTLRKWDRQVNADGGKRWEAWSMRRLMGNTVRDPGQRAQYEHGAWNVFTWVGGIMELGETLPKERQRNVEGTIWLLNSIA